MKENRQLRRFILSKMKAKKRKAFVEKEKFYNEMTRIKKEMEEHWKEVIKKNTPEFQRELALFLLPGWYSKLINRISLAIIALGWKWGAWAFQNVFTGPIQGLVKWVYGFGTKTIVNVLDDDMEMIIKKRGKVIDQKRWNIPGVKNFKIAMKGMQNEQAYNNRLQK